jgi:hypothetical protein
MGSLLLVITIADVMRHNIHKTDLGDYNHRCDDLIFKRFILQEASILEFRVAFMSRVPKTKVSCDCACGQFLKLSSVPLVP